MAKAQRSSRIVLITGASSGIGAATARQISRSNMSLYLVGRDGERLEGVRNETGASAIRADITCADDVARIAEVVRGDAGRLDVLINCAGQLDVGAATDHGVAGAQRLMQVNFFGSISLIEACLPLLRASHQPSIVNVGSLAGRIAPPYMAAYAASKFALTGYTRSLRQELRPEGIHVGLVLPAPVITPMIDGKFGGQYYPRPPGTPVLTPEQVAHAIVRVVDRRIAEAIVPRHMTPQVILASAFPRLTDWFYRVIGAVPASRSVD